MKFFLVIGNILLTMMCWGLYGPILHVGSHGMGDPWRPFICVGIAYFLIGVMVPLAMLKAYGEKGGWTSSGTLWSFIAGLAGAVGALGVVLAFTFGGKPIFVMPLVFGGAPVVNAFVTIYMSKSFKQIGPVFLAGLIMVMLGAVTVLISKPGSNPGDFWESIKQMPSLAKVLAAIALTVVCWGCYGPTLHTGQLKMGGSRLRPLVCVGLAYFAVAVVVPFLLVHEFPEAPHFWTGAFWSLGAGAAGAIGALGVIMAFNFGGKPIYVMPLVFGGAPVVNTFAALIASGTFGQVNPLFYAGLILVASGAAIVLVFAPRGKPHGAPPAKDEKKPGKQEASESEDAAAKTAEA